MFVRVVKKVNQFFLALLAVLVVASLVFTVVFKIYTGKYYKADTEIIADIEAEVGDNVNIYYDDDLLVFVPANQETKAVIVFYSGAKVEFQAYSGLMDELANRGYLCLLPRMPENLALLRRNAAGDIKEKYAKWVQYVDDVDWYLAGHSMGGVAAASYLGESLGEYKGLILCASYTTVDFSNEDIKLLSLIGSEDQVIDRENYEESKVFWPENSMEYIIEGGNHGYFGNYGAQKGDGEPRISNHEQIEIAADKIAEFLSE